MDAQNDNSAALKIAIGTVMVSGGITLVGIAVNSAVQVHAVPWWAILIIVIGTIMLIMGLLILSVPRDNWRRFVYSVSRPLRWINRIYVRKYLRIRYGLKYCICEPNITREFRDNVGTGMGGPRTYYAATLEVVVTKRDKYAIDIYFGQASLYLRHKVEWRWPHITFGVDAGYGETLKQTKSQDTYTIRMNAEVPGDDSNEQFTIANSQWGVRSIRATIRGKQWELHRGIYRSALANPFIGML